MVDSGMVHNLDCKSSSTGVFTWCLNTARNDTTNHNICVWLLAISYVGCVAPLAFLSSSIFWWNWEEKKKRDMERLNPDLGDIGDISRDSCPDSCP